MRISRLSLYWLFVVFASLFLIGCGYEANEGSTDQTVAKVTDSIYPPADKTDGADNVEGYHTVQMSTHYKDYKPVPEAVLKEEETIAAYYPDEAVFDFSTDRYVFRYLVPDMDTEYGDMKNIEKQPPLFKASCSVANVPLECSNKAYLSYNEAEDTPLSRLAHAFITLDESGKLERIDHIEVANQAPCEQCYANARRFIERMPDWSPGKLNGSPVKTQLILPVKL